MLNFPTDCEGQSPSPGSHGEADILDKTRRNFADWFV